MIHEKREGGELCARQMITGALEDSVTPPTKTFGLETACGSNFFCDGITKKGIWNRRSLCWKPRPPGAPRGHGDGNGEQGAGIGVGPPGASQCGDHANVRLWLWVRESSFKHLTDGEAPLPGDPPGQCAVEWDPSGASTPPPVGPRTEFLGRGSLRGDDRCPETKQ